MTTDNFCFYMQNRLIQTGQTGGQWYSDTSPFIVPCTVTDPDEFFSLILAFLANIRLTRNIFWGKNTQRRRTRTFYESDDTRRTLRTARPIMENLKVWSFRSARPKNGFNSRPLKKSTIGLPVLPFGLTLLFCRRYYTTFFSSSLAFRQAASPNILKQAGSCRTPKHWIRIVFACGSDAI
jgi:hypothetical protein